MCVVCEAEGAGVLCLSVGGSRCVMCAVCEGAEAGVWLEPFVFPRVRTVRNTPHLQKVSFYFL
jgi:uncharacterized protein (DUF1810 family)